MSKTSRSDLVAASDRVDTNTSHNRQKFQFFERRSPASQIRRAYDRNSSRSTKNHVPSLSLDESVIEKFEKAKHPLTKSVRRITEKKAELETPRSISHFIMFSSSDASLVAMATVIQRNWRISLYKKKLRRFLDFVLKVRRRRIRYALSMWILSTMPKYELAKKSYTNLYKSLLSYNFLKKKKKSLVFRVSKLRLTTFEEYMKTNILYTIYPAQILVKLHKNFNHKLIQKLFQAWFSIASEHLILSKANNQALIFARYRENFGPEFWTYHVWKRWVYYKKRRKIELVETISSNIYVPEWTYFRAKKLTEARMRREAAMHYRIRLGKQIVQVFRDEIHHRKTMKSAYEGTVKYSNQLSLLFGYRAFQYLIIFKRFRQGCLIRALRAWYTIIDSRMLNRTKLSIFTERIKLKIMRAAFKSWRKNIIEESIKNAFLHDQVSQNSLKLLPFVFLMKNNTVHFTFAKCFINWKKMIDKKKNLKRFVFWSIKIQKKQTLIRFIIDILKDNAKLNFKKLNYLPFCNNPDQGNFTHIPSQQCIMCPTSSLPETIYAYQNVTSYQMYQGDWSKFASALQIRTLFYRLICLIYYKKYLNSNDIREKKIKMIKEFIKRKQLYNQRQVNTVYSMNDKKDKEMKKGIESILQRDVHVITAYDAHSAAIELSNQVPSFSVNNEIKLFNTSPDNFADEEENLNEKADEEEEEDLNEDTYSISSNSTQGSIFPFRRKRTKVLRYSTPSIPFLKPINEVKDSLMKMTLKYRRRPNDAFPLRSFSNRKTRQSFEKNSHRVSAAASNIGSFYEHYVQIQPNKAMIDMVKNKNFSIKELQDLKSQIADVEIELEPIPEFVEKIDEDINEFDYEYEEIEEEEEIKDDSFISETENIIENQNQNDSKNENKLKSQSSSTAAKDFAKVRIGIHEHEIIEETEEEEEKEEKKEEKKENRQKIFVNESFSRFEEIKQTLDNQMVTIDEMEKHFITDDQFNELDQSERISLLTNKYIDVIHLLLGTSNRPQLNPQQISNETTPELTQRTYVSKLLKRIAYKISEENQQSRRNILNYKVKEQKKKPKLFEDPDQQFQEEIHSDGNTYQKSACPEFTNVLFSGVTVLSNTPWQTDNSPQNSNNNNSNVNINDNGNSDSEKLTSARSSSQASSLPSAENVVPGFGPTLPEKSDEEKATLLNRIRRPSSLFVEHNKEVKETLEELINDETIDDSIKIHVLQVIDKIATKYLHEEVERTKKGELTSFVDVDTESASSYESFDDKNPILELKKIDKIKNFDERKFAAFDTESREKPPLHSFNGRRSHFYKDLALAVIECARFMSRKNIKHIEDIRNETSEFEKLKFFKKVQQKQLNDAKRAAEARSRKIISLNLPDKKVDEPVFTAAGVTKWAPPHKLQPTVYYSTRSQKSTAISDKVIAQKILPPASLSSSVSSATTSAASIASSPLSSTSTITIQGTADDSTVQVPLIEITKFDISYKAIKLKQKQTQNQNQKQIQNSNKNDVLLTPDLQKVQLSEKNRPKTQQSLMQRRLQMIHDEAEEKKRKEKEKKKPSIKISSSYNVTRKLKSNSFKSDKNKTKKKSEIVSKTITKINEIPVPIPDPDPMLMNQSSRSMKRKPRFTKFDSVEPEPQVEFEFKPKTSRSLKSNSKYIKPLKPKWRPSTEYRKKVGANDLKYLMYINPYIDHENNGETDNQNNNE